MNWNYTLQVVFFTYDILCVKAADCRRQQISDGGQLEEEAIQTLAGAWLIRLDIIKTLVRVLVRVVKLEAESFAFGHVLPLGFGD